jgi:hypothetical protein
MNDLVLAHADLRAEASRYSAAAGGAEAVEAARARRAQHAAVSLAAALAGDFAPNTVTGLVPPS